MVGGSRQIRVGGEGSGDGFGVSVDVAQDIEGDGERFARLHPIDAGSGPGGYTFDEMSEFEGEWFGFRDAEGIVTDLAIAGDGEGDGFLLVIVEGDVLMGLEDAHFAHAFGVDAAGGDVGDTAPGEGESDVGDVDLVRKDGDAGGADFFGHFTGEGEEDIDVVDH